jgi:hypothetical protein
MFFPSNWIPTLDYSRGYYLNPEALSCSVTLIKCVPGTTYRGPPVRRLVAYHSPGNRYLRGRTATDRCGVSEVRGLIISSGSIHGFTAEIPEGFASSFRRSEGMKSDIGFSSRLCVNIAFNRSSSMVAVSELEISLERRTPTTFE